MSSRNAHDPLVSAIIPVYNGERFVRQAIASVLEQTYERIECIVVDDGSTDATPSIVRQFGEAVKYLREENGGVARARNLGIRAASGELIALLDADDVWLPKKLEVQLAVLRQHPDAAMCYSGIRHVDENLIPLQDDPAAPAAVALRNSLLLEQPYMSIPSTAVIRREVAFGVGLLDERLSTSADTDFACRIALRHEVVAVIEPLVLYRRHGDQMHHDALAMKRDMELVFQKVFGDSRLSPTIARLERRARANLYASVAAQLARTGNLHAAVPLLIRAFVKHPPRTMHLLRRHFKNRKSRTPAISDSA